MDIPDLKDHTHLSRRQIDEASLEAEFLVDRLRISVGLAGLASYMRLKREQLEDCLENFRGNCTCSSTCQGFLLLEWFAMVATEPFKWIQMNTTYQQKQSWAAKIMSNNDIHSPTVLINFLAGSPCSDLACWKHFSAGCEAYTAKDSEVSVLPLLTTGKSVVPRPGWHQHLWSITFFFFTHPPYNQFI